MASNVPFVMETPAWNPAIAGAPFTLDQLAPGTHVAKWTLGNGDDGMPFDAGNYPGKSVSAEGTFSGTTVNVEGRDGQTGVWMALHNQAGVAITFTANGKQEILEDVRQVRFTATAGTGTGLICRLFVVSQARH